MLSECNHSNEELDNDASNVHRFPSFSPEIRRNDSRIMMHAEKSSTAINISIARLRFIARCLPIRVTFTRALNLAHGGLMVFRVASHSYRVSPGVCVPRITVPVLRHEHTPVTHVANKGLHHTAR